MPAFFGDGNTPRRSDTQWIILQKILGALTGSGSSSGGGGITAMQVYVDRAPADPDNVNIAALSYPSAGGPLQQWDINTLSWV